MKEVIKLKFSCTERVSGKPLKYFSFANSNASFLKDEGLDGGGGGGAGGSGIL